MTDSEKCFITGKVDCDLTEIMFEGKVYMIDEELADEHPLKKVKQMISDKLSEVEKDKEDALAMLGTACEKLGINKADLGRLLLGGGAQPEAAAPAATPETPAVTAEVVTIDKESGFEEVDGSLQTKSNPNVNAEEGISVGGQAYARVNDEEGRSIVEDNKKIKRLDDAVVTKSSMGTTVIRMDHRKAHEIEPLLKQVDSDGNLVRAASSGKGYLSGQKTIECPLCRGSGITRVGYKKCPKCGGTGIITV